MHLLTRTLLCGALACALLSPAFAEETKAPEAAPQASAEQKAMMEAWEKATRTGPQHKQLADHFVGTWTTRQTMWMDPAAKPIVETGTCVTTAELGGRHIRMVFKSQFMGQPFEGIALISYDTVTGKYVDSWVDSMATGQYMSEGDFDAATNSYTFRSDMADPMNPGSKTRVRQVTRIVDKDHHVMEWYETHDGKERKSMEIEYARAE